MAPDAVVLDIDDDGTGQLIPAPSPPGPVVPSPAGHGLIGMHERAVSCGGRLMIGLSALGGWQVRAILPILAPVAPA